VARSRRLAFALLVAGVWLLGAACAAGGAGGLGGRLSPRGGSLRREDQVLLTRFADVTGLAASQRLLFVTTPYGIGVYDRRFDSWLPPLTGAGDYDNGRVSFVAADPSIDAVWVGGSGFVLFYQPSVDVLQRMSVPGVVDQILFDRRNGAAGAYVRSAGQWSLVSSTGFVTPVMDRNDLPAGDDQVRPVTLPQIYEQFPALQGFERLLTRDGQLRSWPVSAGTQSPDQPSEVWLGTLGNGLFKVNPYFNTSEHLAFGLLDRGAGAVALAADGVWAAGLGDAQSGGRGGLTFISEDLQEWRWVEGALAQPLAGARAYALDVRGQTAWLGTDRGVARVDTRGEGDVVVWAGITGLPDDRALAVLARPDGAWVGTARGLVFVSDSASSRSAQPEGIGPTVASGTPVRALLATGDTLWVGTDAGLLLLPPGNDTLARRPAAATQEPRLAQPIRAIAHSDSLVVVANADELLRFNLNTGQLLPRLDAVNVRAVGQVNVLAMDDRTIWVGGPLGVLVVDRGTGASRLLGPAYQVTSETFDIALAPDYAWLATREGVVRLRRLPDGTVR